jgi:hypothetical protein
LQISQEITQLSGSKGRATRAPFDTIRIGSIQGRLSMRIAFDAVGRTASSGASVSGRSTRKPEGQLPQQIGQESDEAKLALMEQFVAVFQ